ncbi:hypothetical protein FLA_2121 [Filimonas lacunae]|nr:hypothetical protein FLA_2121 [Filimonas lacunae]
MKLDEQVLQRSEGQCELCKANGALKIYEVPPVDRTTEDN